MSSANCACFLKPACELGFGFGAWGTVTPDFLPAKFRGKGDSYIQMRLHEICRKHSRRFAKNRGQPCATETTGIIDGRDDSLTYYMRLSYCASMVKHTQLLLRSS